MATTVNGAFSEFLIEKVRLDSERTKMARSSKNWLIEEIKKFPDDREFPPFHPDIYIEYGSFSRKTKIRPLDDIDIMFILHGQGATYNSSSYPIGIFNSANSKYFSDLYFPGTNQFSSIKLLNKFKEHLAAIPQYKHADIKRNQEAITLELQSYEWAYDIVPCFITNPEWDGRSYFLIPDGTGHWKKTDPRIDKKNITVLEAANDVSVVDVIRLVKYWNCRPTMPSIMSYCLETLLINFYKSGAHSKWVDVEFKNALAYIADAVLNPVNDPKNIQGDLNTLSWTERTKIRERALADFKKAEIALGFEQDSKTKESIDKWGEIFGPEFPLFTSQLVAHA